LSLVNAFRNKAFKYKCVIKRILPTSFYQLNENKEHIDLEISFLEKIIIKKLVLMRKHSWDPRYPQSDCSFVVEKMTHKHVALTKFVKPITQKDLVIKNAIAIVWGSRE
jgi:hypothetical protein